MNVHEIYVPGKGPVKPAIAIVGEAPAHEEVQALEPFVGSSGRFLNGLLADVGIQRESCWVTNVCKYMVPGNIGTKKIPFNIRANSVGIDVGKQIEELRTELTAIQPNVIIALGGTALWALTGKSPITSFRGSILNGMGFKTIGTYHPAHILRQDGEVRGYWNKQVMLFDLARAFKQSTFKDIRLPNRRLKIAQNAGELYDFIERNKNNSKLSVDIEAMDCVPVCVGLAFSKSEGLTVPLWNIKGLTKLPDSQLINMWAILADVLAKKQIIGQNFGYDRDKLKRLGFVIKNFYADTMLKAFCINPELPKNLAFNTSIYTEEPYYKDEGMYEGSVEDLLIGCARDACVTYEVNDGQDKDLIEMNLVPFYDNFIHHLHDLYAHIEQTGFHVDKEVRNSLIRKYIEWDEKVRYQLFQVSGEYVNTGSPKQVSELLYDKWKIPARVGTGEEVLTGLLNNVVKDPIKKLGIELILEDRRIKKTIDTYLMSPEDYDGRMKTSYFLCLETGRSATMQQNPPIRPSVIYKDGSVKKKTSRGMAFQTITKHGDIGADVRTMLVADEGEIILQADSSQAEARVIFLLAEDYDALYAIDHHDYHALTASWFFGGCEDDYSKKKLGYESPIRFAGKTLRHAGHLGAGARRAATELNTQARKYKIPITISEAKARVALDTFHKKQPKIRAIFQEQVKACLTKNRTLIAPVPHGIDAPVGGTRIFYERWNDELFRQAFSYIPQRSVSENTKGAALRIRARADWIRIAVEAHDALAVLVPIDRKLEAANIMREEFERPIDFSTCSLPRGKLVIPCEIEEGYNYKDLSKFKL